MHIEELITHHSQEFNFTLVAGKEGIKNSISNALVESPGLALAGYLQGFEKQKILIFGSTEMSYLQEMGNVLRIQRLQQLLTQQIPAVIIAQGLSPLHEITELCEEQNIPLLCTHAETSSIMVCLGKFLRAYFAPTLCCHGSLVEVFELGILLQGVSGIGKSEAALGLIKRGHKLISDDIVRIKKLDGNILEGGSIEISKNYLEVREIGLIDITKLYGMVCVREKKNVDLVVKLELWDNNYFYDRAGLDEQLTSIFGIEIPLYILPIKPGRDVVLLIETIALNHKLKKMGYHSAQKFDSKLIEHMNGR